MLDMMLLLKLAKLIMINLAFATVYVHKRNDNEGSHI